MAQRFLVSVSAFSYWQWRQSRSERPQCCLHLGCDFCGKETTYNFLFIVLFSFYF